MYLQNRPRTCLVSLEEALVMEGGKEENAVAAKGERGRRGASPSLWLQVQNFLHLPTSFVAQHFFQAGWDERISALPPRTSLISIGLYVLREKTLRSCTGSPISKTEIHQSNVWQEKESRAERAECLFPFPHLISSVCTGHMCSVPTTD